MDKAIIDKYDKNMELNDVLNTFEQKYLQYYRDIKTSGKTRLVKYSAVFFKKWYHSTLINQTNLSPGLLFDSRINDRANGSVVIPTIKPKMSGKILKGFDISLLEFTADNHPISNDLKVLVESCHPDSPLKDESNLPQAHKDMLLGKVSQYNPCYVEYLTALAYKLNLLRNMASIHSYKVQAVPNWEVFFDKPPRERLNDIINAAIKLCSTNINSILPKGVNIFNESFIKDLLKSPHSIDEIFAKVFATFGLDIEAIMNKQNEMSMSEMPFIDEESAMLMSSTFFLGILIDQWFLSPFGQYLQLIQPLYFFEFLFKTELNFLLEDINAMEDVTSSLYSPSTFYTISNLGKTMFKCTKIKKNDEFRRIKSKLPFKELVESMIIIINSPQYISNQENEEGSYYEDYDDEFIFQLKLTSESPKKISKIIEIDADVTLHDTHKYICEIFNLNMQKDYVFQMERIPSPFSSYSAPWRKNKTKKADTVTLSEIFDDEREEIYYITDEISITIKFVFAKELDDETYPRIVSDNKKTRKTRTQRFT